MQKVFKANWKLKRSQICVEWCMFDLVVHAIFIAVLWSCLVARVARAAIGLGVHQTVGPDLLREGKFSTSNHFSDNISCVLKISWGYDFVSYYIWNHCKVLHILWLNGCGKFVEIFRKDLCIYRIIHGTLDCHNVSLILSKTLLVLIECKTGC